uniref:Uncharacterized protein n=1 Tax=Diabrotica virgifera virgifera TaxID=50390 RepID=D7P0E9_DIAVI|nr:hypothetical protein [Diabrotica virgifera virgifera]
MMIHRIRKIHKIHLNHHYPNQQKQINLINLQSRILTKNLQIQRLRKDHQKGDFQKKDQKNNLRLIQQNKVQMSIGLQINLQQIIHRQSNLKVRNMMMQNTDQLVLSYSCICSRIHGLLDHCSMKMSKFVEYC